MKNPFTNIIPLLCLLLLSTILFTSCSDFATDDRKSVQLILKKEGKTYLFSSLGTMITKNKLNKKESPTLVKSTRIVEKDNQLYTETQHLKNIATIISGNYVIHDFPEKLFDGYISAGKHKVYDKKYVEDPTEKLGETISMAHIYLSDIDQTSQYHISWQRSPNKRAIKNCIEMALWADKSYKPGEQTIAKNKFIMIDLKDLVEFYNPSIQLDYVEEEEVLYVIMN